jgi:signal recognition particle receptor subunit beta
VHYRASRRLILRGVDGVVFVADSQRGRLDADAESMSDLAENLADEGQALEKVPLVIQYNKRDLDDIAPIEELRELLNPRAVPEMEASAAKGVGVFETLKAVGRLALTGLKLPKR